MEKAKEYFAIYQMNDVWSSENDTLQCYVETKLYFNKLFTSEEHALAIVDNLRSDGVSGLFVAKIYQ